MFSLAAHGFAKRLSLYQCFMGGAQRAPAKLSGETQGRNVRARELLRSHRGSQKPLPFSTFSLLLSTLFADSVRRRPLKTSSRSATRLPALSFIDLQVSTPGFNVTQSQLCKKVHDYIIDWNAETPR
jgi:hypothetical protein